MDNKTVTEWQERGKDASPANTVERIRELLSQAEIPVIYEELPVDVASCYSGRIEVTCIQGGIVGANGKGVSSELCAASAYAELMERLQNRIFAYSGPYYGDKACFIRQKEILGYPWYSVKGDYQPRCIQAIKDKIAASYKPDNVFAPDAHTLVDDLIEKVSEYDGKFCLFPFWSVSDKKEVMLPRRLLIMAAMSNGMAAGNTLEEAVVQASAEIFERYVNIVFMKENIIPPEIPREYLMRFPTISRIMEQIEKKEDYEAHVFDLSLGKGLPVVCGAIMNRRTQTFGLKFGAHPNIAVAIERVFSEAMQGRSLEQFCRTSYPGFEEYSKAAYFNTWNLIKVGMGCSPARLFYKSPDYEFVPWEDVSQTGNRGLMKKMIAKLEELGGDVYIEDVSFLGFPSVFVFAQGVSEAFDMDMLFLKELKLQRDVQTIMRHLDTATDAEVSKVLQYCMIKRNAILENTFNGIGWFAFHAPMFSAPDDCGFLAAVCCYRLGDPKKALAYLESMKGAFDDMPEECAGYCRTALYYMRAVVKDVSDEDRDNLIRAVSTDRIAEKVIDDFSDPAKVLQKVYPVCNHGECASCVHNKECDYENGVAFDDKLIKMQTEKNIRTERLAALFAENEGSVLL